MLRDIKIEELPSWKIATQRGIEQGIEKGIEKAVFGIFSYEKNPKKLLKF